MQFYAINEFAAGLDLRRSSLTAPPGTLRVLQNAHVTPGGEIEKRFSFVKIADVDPASFGLTAVNQKLYVFSTGGPGKLEPTGTWTVGVLQLAVPSIEKIIDWDLFDNRVFVVVDIGGDVLNYCFDGALVTGARGRYVRTYKTKMFSVEGSVLYFSAVGDASDWAGTGSGSLDLSLEDADMTDTRSLEVYYDKLAIFSETACQLWMIDPDPLKTQYSQTLRQAGTSSPLSVLQYGSGDVLYVSPDGIRSLRARNSSLAASVSDVGSPLDPIMQALFRTMGEEWMSRIVSVIQPVTGRFWVILPDRIYILSSFPGPRITAWSEYIPEFNITAAVIYQQHVVVRDDANQVFVYGGTDPTQPIYDSCPVALEFPFHGGDKPTTKKFYRALNAAAEGVLDIYAALNPRFPDAEDYLGQINGPTFMDGQFSMVGLATHISVRLRSQAPGPVKLSNMVLHYEYAEPV
jgi:hypothetical protein